MKLRINKRCFYAHDHLNATEYKEGTYTENDDPVFCSWIIDNGFGVEAQRERKIEKVDIPEENKALDNVPQENKASVHAFNETQKKSAPKKRTRKK